MLNLKKSETPTGYTISLEDYLKLPKQEKSLFCCEFCYYSNLIEGIRIPYIETITIGEETPIRPELGDHYKAFEYMTENFRRIPCEEDIKRIHGILMKNLLRNPECIGKYRKCKIWVGGNGGPRYRQIPELMKNLEKHIYNLKGEKTTDENLWNIHNEFETIHPFVDGNGRTGRLLLNWLSLKHLSQFNIVTMKKREEYYQTIRRYKEQFKKDNPKVKFDKNIKLKPRYNLEDLNFLRDFFKK